MSKILTAAEVNNKIAELLTSQGWQSTINGWYYRKLSLGGVQPKLIRKYAAPAVYIPFKWYEINIEVFSSEP